jgi:hypothetical protein
MKYQYRVTPFEARLMQQHGDPTRGSLQLGKSEAATSAAFDID